MAPRLLAKSDPTAGALVSLYDGLSFLINNRQQLAGFFEGLADTMGNLAASINDPDPDVRTAKVAEFTRGIVTAVTDRGLNVLLDFAASQLGLGGLKRGVQNVIQFIPNQVDSLMRRIVGAVASRVTALLPGGGSTSLYGGLVGTVRTFSYQGQSYTLWADKPRSGPIQVKIAQGTRLVAVLTPATFNEAIRPGSRGRLALVISKANDVASANSPRLASERVAPLTTAETNLIQDIMAGACTAVNTGCFAAGTKLWTPRGYRNVEEIREGDLVYARDESDPEGTIAAKVVEQTFQRTGRILHLHLPGGQLVRTTPEHPFYVRDKGWTAAGALAVGDAIRTDSGWTVVEDLLDTGDYETVYNVRVADWHTYFVGEWDWPFAVWAHNTYAAFSGLRVAEDAGLTGDVKAAVDQRIRDDGAFGNAAGLTGALRALVQQFGTASDLQTRLLQAVDQALNTPAVRTARQQFYAGLDRQDWNGIINNRYGGVDCLGASYPGDNMTLPNGTTSRYRTHAHHIVYKVGLGARQPPVVLEAQDVLLYYNIDPFYSQAVLVWAPNRGHPMADLEDVRNRLIQAYRDGATTSDIVEVLRQAARGYLNRST